MALSVLTRGPIGESDSARAERLEAEVRRLSMELAEARHEIRRWEEYGAGVAAVVGATPTRLR